MRETASYKNPFRCPSPPGRVLSFKTSGGEETNETSNGLQILENVYHIDAFERVYPGIKAYLGAVK